VIYSVRDELTEAHRMGDISRARIVWGELMAQVKARSPRQVERMEVAKGLR
jgi:hypothetical protein